MSRKKIAVMAEGQFSAQSAKTAAGVIRYSPHEIVAVIDSQQVGRTVQEILGYGGPIPIVSAIEETLPLEPEVLLIGIAPAGGRLPEPWRQTISAAISNRLEIWSGLHFFLSRDEEFASLAKENDVRLWDVRLPGPDLRVADGSALAARPFVVLLIGSDCNVGKMTAALEIQRIASDRGYNAAFLATGQTGILIEGEGTPLDAIPGDFMSGEVERFILEYEEQGADVIFVEGQGALLHPGFGSVTLALMLGSMPDAYIFVHQPSRTTYRPVHKVPIPPVLDIIRNYEAVMEPYKAPKVLGIAMNTYGMTDEDAQKSIREIAEATGLPAVDPIRGTADALFEALEPQIRKKLGMEAETSNLA